MFGIGMQEIIVILILALIVIGPKKLPEVAKALGRGYGEFRRAFEDMRSSINADINAPSKTPGEAEKLKELNENYPPPLQKPAAAGVEAQGGPEDSPGASSDSGGKDPYRPDDLPEHDPVEEEEPGDRG